MAADGAARRVGLGLGAASVPHPLGLVGAVLAAGFAVAVIIMSRVGFIPTFLTQIGAENAPLIWLGIFAGASVLFAGLGFVLARKT